MINQVINQTQSRQETSPRYLGLWTAGMHAAFAFWVSFGLWSSCQPAVQQEPVSSRYCQDPGVNPCSMRRPELTSSQFPGVQRKKVSEK